MWKLTPGLIANSTLIGLAVTQSHATRERKAHAALSQSERDWAYAKRALARGEGQEAIIQAMATFRSDKPDPQYYARHTVTKAAAGMDAQGKSKDAQDKSQQQMSSGLSFGL